MSFHSNTLGRIPLRQKQFWLPGAALLLTFLLLLGCSYSFDYLFAGYPAVGVILDELVSFGIPAFLVYRLRDDTFPLNLRLERRKGYYIQYFGFTVKFALTVSFLSFLANLFVFALTGSSEIALPSIVYGNLLGGQYTFLSFIAIVVVPPIVEELYLRGILFSAMENIAGTKICIIMSGLCFALLHANPNNLIGPFLAGCAYAYLSYSFDSLGPAIIAHVVNNLYYYIINHLVTVYSSFGIWRYFTFINLILFLLSLYLMLRSLTTQIQHDKLRPFRPNSVGLRPTIAELIANPGFFMFCVAFLFSILFR